MPNRRLDRQGRRSAPSPANRRAASRPALRECAASPPESAPSSYRRYRRSARQACSTPTPRAAAPLPHRYDRPRPRNSRSASACRRPAQSAPRRSGRSPWAPAHRRFSWPRSALPGSSAYRRRAGARRTIRSAGFLPARATVALRQHSSVLLARLLSHGFSILRLLWHQSAGSGGAQEPRAGKSRDPQKHKQSGRQACRTSSRERAAWRP